MKKVTLVMALAVFSFRVLAEGGGPAVTAPLGSDQATSSSPAPAPSQVQPEATPDQVSPNETVPPSSPTVSQVNAPVESAAQPQPQAQVEPSRTPRWHGSVYLYGNSARQVKFDNVKTTTAGSTANSSYVMNAESAGGLGGEIWMSEPRSWGLSVGLTWDAKRKINSADVTSLGSTVHTDYAEPKPTLSFATLYANAIYRWDTLYLPFGLNISVPSFKQGDGANGTLSMKGSLGLQVGLGFQVVEHFSIEMIERVTAVRMTGTSGSTATDFGTGFLSGALVNFRFDF